MCLPYLMSVQEKLKYSCSNHLKQNINQKQALVFLRLQANIANMNMYCVGVCVDK